jgi:hypothetical protein
MGDDNSELILEAILATHQQQLQTLRQRRLSLLRIASFNIILLSILVGLAGLTVEARLSIGFFEFLIPIGLVIIAILMAIIKYKDFGEHWGYGLSREFTAEMNTMPRDSALEELVGIYEAASEENKDEIRAIDKWIFRIILVMSISLGSLLGIIMLSA